MSHLALCGGSPVRESPPGPWPTINSGERKALLEVYDSGKWGIHNGERVGEFEEKFSAYHDSKWGVAVVNGTVALSVALKALDIGPGHEVIVPPYTFLATASAVLEVGATPIFVDIDSDTYNIDLSQIEPAITPDTRAIIPVHFAGLPVDMERLCSIATANGLKIVEDCAHAHGAKWAEKGVGSWGDLGAFSFQASKNMNAGEGGIIVGSDPDLRDRVRAFVNCGRLPGSQWYEHHVLGGNFRMTQFQGAILLGQLKRLEAETAIRDGNGRFLNEGLASIEGLSSTLRDIGETNQAHHLYVLKFDREGFGRIDKFRFAEAMKAENTPVNTGYNVPIYRQPLFVEKNFWPRGTPKSDAMYAGLPDWKNMFMGISEKACSSEALWIEQQVMLCDRSVMQQYLDAAAKIREYQEELLD